MVKKLLHNKTLRIVLASVLTTTFLLFSLGAGTGYLSLGMITGTPDATTYLRGDLTWETPTGGDGAPIFIAASDATAEEKSWATATGGVICDGTADQTDISGLIVSGAILELSSGTFVFDGQITKSGVSNWKLFSTSGAKLKRTAAFQMFFLTACDYVTLDGLEIYCDPDNSHVRLMRVDYSSFFWVTNCKIHDFYEWIIFVPYWNGTHEGCTNIHIENNEIYNYHFSVMDFGDGCEWVHVKGNYFHDGTRGLVGQYAEGAAPNLYAIATGWIGDWDASANLTAWLFIEDNTLNGHDYWNAFDIHSGVHVRIKNNKMKNITDTTYGVAIYYHGGFDDANTPVDLYDVVIENNQIDACTTGIHIDSPMKESGGSGSVLYGLAVNNNEVRSYSSRGINLNCYNTASTGIKYFNVNNNICQLKTTSYAYGVAMQLASDTLVGISEGNVIGNTLDGNSASVSADCILVLSVVTKVNVVGNTLDKGVTAGIYLNNADYCTVSHNKIFNGGTYAIRLYDGIGMDILDNTIDTATTGIDADQAAVVSPVIKGNKLINCDNWIVYTGATGSPIVEDNEIHGLGSARENTVSPIGTMNYTIGMYDQQVLGKDVVWVCGDLFRGIVGTALSISFYGKKYLVDANVKFAIYDVNWVKIAQTDGVLVNDTSKRQWWTCVFASPPTLTDQFYYVATNSDQDMNWCIADSSDFCWYKSEAYGTFSTPLNPTHHPSAAPTPIFRVNVKSARESIEPFSYSPPFYLEHHTADDTLRLVESNSVHTNLGEDSEVTLTLPASATSGSSFTFVVMVAQQLRIEISAASKSFYINGGISTDDSGADLYAWADDEGECITFTSDGNGNWVVTNISGTWTVTQP